MSDMSDYTYVLLSGQGDFVQVVSTWSEVAVREFPIPPGCYIKPVNDGTLTLLKAGKCRVMADGGREYRDG